MQPGGGGGRVVHDVMKGQSLIGEAGHDRIATFAAVECVVLGSAVQGVVAGSAVERVVASAANQQVAEIVGCKGICQGRADNGCNGIGRAGQREGRAQTDRLPVVKQEIDGHGAAQPGREGERVGLATRLIDLIVALRIAAKGIGVASRITSQRAGVAPRVDVESVIGRRRVVGEGQLVIVSAPLDEQAIINSNSPIVVDIHDFRHEPVSGRLTLYASLRYAGEEGLGEGHTRDEISMVIAGATLERPIQLANLLEVGLKNKPDEPALVSLEENWSWRELDQASTRLARQYLALGLVSGDRVASLLPNRGALLIHYLACFKAGLAATPLNYRYQAPEIDHALEVSGASLLVAHAERGDLLAASRQVPRLRLGRISYGAEGGGGRHLEDLMAADGPPSSFPPPQPTAPAFIFFTSGSTGKPKGVTHSHDTFGWMVASAIAGLALTPADVFLPATSASHIAATSLSFAGLAAGACVAIARSFGGDEVLPLLRNTRPSLLCMLPAALCGLVRDHGARAARLPIPASLRFRGR